MNNFAILDINYSPSVAGVVITLPTNSPCHLTCYWTDKQPLKHHTTRVVRGLAVPWGVYFCFVAWHAVEQVEAGDTIHHTFNITPWPVCETRWFTFRGTIGSEISPSVGPIFELHHTVSTHIDEQPIFDSLNFFLPHRLRIGQLLTVSNRTISQLGFWLSLANPAVADIYFVIRRASDDTVLAFKLWGVANDVPPVATFLEVTLNAPVYVNELVRITAENVGGAGVNRLRFHFSAFGGDVKPGEVYTHFQDGAWVEPFATWDAAYRYTYYTL